MSTFQRHQHQTRYDIHPVHRTKPVLKRIAYEEQAREDAHERYQQRERRRTWARRLSSLGIAFGSGLALAVFGTFALILVTPVVLYCGVRLWRAGREASGMGWV